jgi:RNA polymerase sigma-70 factor, ECF subfamily
MWKISVVSKWEAEMNSGNDERELEEALQVYLRTPDEDLRSLGGLFDRHRNELRRLVARRISGFYRKRLDPSDVIQEAQLDALQRLPDYAARRPMSFRDWLLRTALERLLKLRRHALAARRDMGRERALGENSSSGGRRLCSAEPTPSQQAIARERTNRISDFMERLSEPDREILQMRTYQSLAYEDIGQALGIDPATARKRYGRALLRLRALLVAQGLTESRL